MNSFIFNSCWTKVVYRLIKKLKKNEEISVYKAVEDFIESEGAIKIEGKWYKLELVEMPENN